MITILYYGLLSLIFVAVIVGIIFFGIKLVKKMPKESVAKLWKYSLVRITTYVIVASTIIGLCARTLGLNAENKGFSVLDSIKSGLFLAVLCVTTIVVITGIIVLVKVLKKWRQSSNKKPKKEGDTETEDTSTKKDDKKKDKKVEGMKWYLRLLVCIGLAVLWYIGLTLLGFNLPSPSSLMESTRSTIVRLADTAVDNVAATQYMDYTRVLGVQEKFAKGHMATFACDNPKAPCPDRYISKDHPAIYPFQRLLSTPQTMEFTILGEGCVSRSEEGVYVSAERCDVWHAIGACKEGTCTGAIHEEERDPALGDMTFTFTWTEFGKIGVGRILELNVQFSVQSATGTYLTWANIVDG